MLIRKFSKRSAHSGYHKVIGARLNAPMHSHSENEITLITRGRGRRLFNGTSMPFREGDLVLIGSNLPHCWQMDRRSGWSKGFDYITIHFHDDFLGRNFFQRQEIRSIRNLIRRMSHGVRFFGGARDLIAKKLKNDFSKLKNFDYSFRLLKVLYYLSNSAEYQILSGPGWVSTSEKVCSSKHIHDVCRFVDRNYAGAIHQSDVAKKNRMNPSMFSRFFKRETGRTFSAYVNEVRIDEACQSLKEGRMSIAEICFSCGFSNLSNFNRRFLKLKGMSPRAFRRQF